MYCYRKKQLKQMRKNIGNALRRGESYLLCANLLTKESKDEDWRQINKKLVSILGVIDEREENDSREKMVISALEEYKQKLSEEVEKFILEIDEAIFELEDD